MKNKLFKFSLQTNVTSSLLKLYNTKKKLRSFTY